MWRCHAKLSVLWVQPESASKTAVANGSHALTAPLAHSPLARSPTRDLSDLGVHVRVSHRAVTTPPARACASHARLQPWTPAGRAHRRLPHTRPPPAVGSWGFRLLGAPGGWREAPGQLMPRRSKHQLHGPEACAPLPSGSCFHLATGGSLRTLGGGHAGRQRSRM